MMWKSCFIMCVSILFLLFASINTHAGGKNREDYEKTGQVIWESNTEAKVVALTFDDGPSDIYTPVLLEDILNQRRTYYNDFK